MTKTALEIVQNFQQSLAEGTEQWQDLFSETVTFKGPVQTCVGKAENIELNKNFFPLVRGYDHKSSFEQGKYVSLEGVLSVATPKNEIIKLDLVEIYEIEEGLIQNIRIYYDAEEFRKEFSN